MIEKFMSLGIKVLMVGDANQTLYAFRGACANTFNRYFHDSRFVSYELKDNFRCHRIINEIAKSYSFPEQHIYEETMGYFVLKFNQVSEICKKFENESIAFLKKKNVDLLDYDGLFSILKDISFSPDLEGIVKKIVICFLKLKFKVNYNFYCMLSDLMIDIDHLSKNELDSFRNNIETYISEDKKLSKDIVIWLGIEEFEIQIDQTYNSLIIREETKQFIQNYDKHVTMTIHSSKGLEFDNVILRVGDFYYNGVLDRTNYYVSMTRARKRIFVIF